MLNKYQDKVFLKLGLYTQPTIPHGRVFWLTKNKKLTRKGVTYALSCGVLSCGVLLSCGVKRRYSSTLAKQSKGNSGQTLFNSTPVRRGGGGFFLVFLNFFF